MGPSAASNCYPVRFCYLLGGGQSSSFFVCPWNGAGVGGPSPCGLRGALRVPFVSGVLRGDRPLPRILRLAGWLGWLELLSLFTSVWLA